MSELSRVLTAEQLFAQLYDLSMQDWPGEIEFYRAWAIGRDVLEIACGTGRVSLQLAQGGVNMTGVDLSAEMLAVARGKSQGIANARWLQGDMRSFQAAQGFELVIIPGHSFQHMLTPEDQVTCLACIKRHLTPDGILVVHLDHQDVRWLAERFTEKKGIFAVGNEAVRHPATGTSFRSSRAWVYEPSTQTATVTILWEQIGADGSVLARWQRRPMPLHCVFRFEMEHLLGRVGFSVEAVYGDFFRHPLTDNSEHMIWVARNSV